MQSLPVCAGCVISHSGDVCCRFFLSLSPLPFAPSPFFPPKFHAFPSALWKINIRASFWWHKHFFVVNFDMPSHLTLLLRQKKCQQWLSPGYSPHLLLPEPDSLVSFANTTYQHCQSTHSVLYVRTDLLSRCLLCLYCNMFSLCKSNLLVKNKRISLELSNHYFTKERAYCINLM